MMTRHFNRIRIAGALLLVILIAGAAWQTSHRVTSLARRHLDLDLAATPFGASPSSIAGLTPYRGNVPHGWRALEWYSKAGAAPSPHFGGFKSTGTEVLYGFSHGKLAEIRVTRLAFTAGEQRAMRRLISSISPNEFSVLRRTGQFQLSDWSLSLHFMGACDPFNPLVSSFTIMPNSQ